MMTLDFHSNPYCHHLLNEHFMQTRGLYIITYESISCKHIRAHTQYRSPCHVQFGLSELIHVTLTGSREASFAEQTMAWIPNGKASLIG